MKWKIEKANSGKGYVILNEIGLALGRQYSKADCNHLVKMVAPHTVDSKADTLEATFGDAWPELKKQFEEFASPRCLCGHCK